MYIALQPMVSLIAGILILIIPRLLNYIVAIYLNSDWNPWAGENVAE
jgi:Protein of unknown function (DUF3096)